MAPRLKSMELHGYKTFASHTLFKFSEQITAIVGPNGSGKSNIADSIRWVLGEQSYSLLRGRKTEDMIFAGSEQRSRAGIASATIIFDNEDGWLPIDFAEVSITRRAYRDGQNEYLLNGQKVRLKEISELLAQSGLAERTYTIIGQGLVDAALSLRPEERRRFFEEAAGIGLYRRRREESLNRLETTRRNMDRVLDIISEIEPRLANLEKAARRAQEYLRIQADLRVLLREWYGYHWHRNQQEVVHAQEVYRVQHQRLDQVRINLSEIEKHNDEQRTAIQKLRADLNTWHSQSAELHRQRENYNRSLAVMDERQQALTEQQNVASIDLAKLEEEAKAHQDRQKTMQDEHAHLKTELTEAQAQAQKARANLQKRQIDRAEIEKRLRDLRNALQNNETKQFRLKAHQVELHDRRKTFLETSKKTALSLSTEEENYKRVQLKLTQAKEEQSRIENEFHALETELQTIRSQISQIEKERRQAQEERSKLGAEAARLKSQLDVLEQAERSLSGHSQGSRFIIEATRKGLLQGKFKALNTELEVPVEYEKAVASVLGEHLHSLLLDHRTDADLALKLLETGDKGRAVLLPLDLIPSSDPLPPITDPDCLGNVLELIHIGDTLKPFLKVLLGNVYIVRDRQAAYRIKVQLPPEAKAVTLQGEVFWGNGLIISGQDASVSLISRPRQKRELQEKSVQVQERLSEQDKKIQHYDLALSQQHNLEQELNKKIIQARTQLNQVVQSSQKADLETAQTRQRVEFHRSQVSSIELQNKNVEKEIQGLDKDLLALDETITQSREQVRVSARERDAISLEEFQAEEVHWNTNAAVITRAVKNAESRYEEYTQLLKNNQQQREVLNQRLENLTSTLQKLGNDKQIQRIEEQKINESIARLQQDIAPAEQVLESAEKEYSRLQNILSTTQQTVNAAERNEAQGQIELTRQRESLESLRRRIEEDFGLVAFEFEPEVSGQTPLPLDGIVTQLPVIVDLSPDIEDGISRFRSQLRRMGAVNPDSQKEYQEVLERSHFLKAQMEDLRKADSDLRQVISELDELMKTEFKKTFDAVAVEFRGMFTRLFGGGTAHLNLTDADHPTETGIEIEARLPGRREQGLEQLSGGERSLTAVALVFSLLKISPTPFCVLDEVDAALDESNVGRFGELLTELSQKTQFIVVTHNRGTVQTANIIYGVTMGRDSASQIISLKLDEVNEDMVR
jgi:chromosome segregation protein